MRDALMRNYARADLAFERGEGAWLYTEDGRRFLDFTAGIAVCSLGHAHPHLVQALQEQAAKLWHTSNLFRIPQGEKLAARLAERSFAERVFFCNSGVEAFEAAAKIVRKHFADRGEPKRHRIIACSGSFHGRSLAAIAASGNAKYLEGFGPAAPGYDQVPFGASNELRNAITDETAAILVEPIQGEGGIRTARLEFLRELRRVCDEFGLLLIFDEIQCGMGRTGKLFACEWADVTPDVMMLAKGLGGGFPIGALLTTEKVAAAFAPGTHGTTFGGNPLAMACGNAVLDELLRPGFLDQVRETGDDLWQKLEGLVQRHPQVFEAVRGAGLMLGLKCRVPAGEVIAAAQERGLLTVGAAENVVRLLPPLIIGRAEVDTALGILEETAGSFAAAEETA
ncbi:aspartate aminotransferase family protein [Aquibaculum arenosum]|uniref:Acetylornithine aminotransferase n=1 Tax=Aquibaculum arenosum TaxID=3032591 RepID=A0ABT5YL83_9PROT|nr:aspartate aminotransferase family protein [Fodinicurvata sp. CAU 1616]MDF2095716.1 aspartate aminotransferase family protein [Fodinicurvata sp. CAU 1616]